MQLLIIETESIVEAYRNLHELTELGHSPLEFSPHAQGVRLIFKINAEKSIPAHIKGRSFQLSDTLIKAYLSLSDATLLDELMVIENESFGEILKISQSLEDLGAKVFEIRSFKSNPKKNYALVTFNKGLKIEPIIGNFKHTVISSQSSALKDFLGFK